MDNARNVNFQISLRKLIHIINPVDGIKLSGHRRSTTISLETHAPSQTTIPAKSSWDTWARSRIPHPP